MDNLVRFAPCNFRDSAQAKTYRLFDVSKQVVGQMFIHSANLLISGIASHRTSGNACVSYLLNILIDTTIGESCYLTFISHVNVNLY